MVTCPICGHVNPDRARFCNECASPLEAEQRPPGEERKTVTVVFVDLVGFTAQAENLDPEDVRGVLSPYHAHLRAELAVPRKSRRRREATGLSAANGPKGQLLNPSKNLRELLERGGTVRP
jgi:hypothetical protein